MGMNRKFIDCYYSKRVSLSDDRMYQVGKTVGGIPVEDENIEVVVNNIAVGLKMSSQDEVTDIGCGNGIITERIAQMVTKVIGIDRSAQLLGVLKGRKPDNVELVCCDLSELSIGDVSSKIYLYEVVQHLTHKELADFLFMVSGKEEVSVFLGGILDAGRVFEFFVSEEQKSVYFELLEKQRDSELGTWWHREHIYNLAMRAGLRVSISNQPKSLYTSHYRFDALLYKPY